MSDELPQGWVTTSLAELLTTLESGSRPRGGVRGIAEGIPSVGGEHLNYTGGFNFESVKYVPKEFAAGMSRGRIQRNDILVVKDGATTGKTAFIDSRFPFDEAFVNEHVFICRPTKEIEPQFLFRFLTSMDGQKRILENFKGSAQGGINQTFAPNTEVPLAPLAEQRRIVAKLEKLLGQVDASQQRLTKIPVLLKRFRQSVLAAACSGRLTADWREENSDVESARSLIERINEVRKKSPKAQEVELIPEGECPDDIVPKTWEWVRFGSVIGELRNGVPLRPNIEPPGVPILRISAARPGVVNLDDFRFMPVGEQFVPQFTLRDNDLIFTRYNGTVEFLGTCGMVRGLGKRTLLYPDKLMRVRFDHDSVLPAYAEVFFQAPHVHERVVAKSKSSAGQNGISGSDIKGQPFALPPLAEQQEIVRRVAGLFALADQLEQRLAQARRQVDQLTPSLLARAFTGKLVPQDPNDEPASVLLERIEKQHDRRKRR